LRDFVIFISFEEEGPMTTLSTPAGGEADFVRCAGQADHDGDVQQTTQPGPEKKPHGEPAKPTDKPLPDLPNPSEVGEDG
jgi:hypothetical protein